MCDSLNRYMDELANHTAEDAEYRAIIAKRVRDKMEDRRTNDNERIAGLDKPDGHG